MKASTRTRTGFAALAFTAALVAAVPTAGYAQREPGTPAAAAKASHPGPIVLRRDGSKAVPFVRSASPSPSVAVPSAAAPDGFDWGDAAIGAAGAMVVALLASGALVLTKRRRHAGVRPTVAA
jgi:hypothetical protein